MMELVEVPPPQPLFFLSYARTGAGADHVPAGEAHQQVLRFFTDLSSQVVGLTARRTGADPGFMDRTIPTGTSWARELLVALGACQAFVALLCGPYATSEWCGMEWYAFSGRKVFDA